MTPEQNKKRKKDWLDLKLQDPVWEAAHRAKQSTKRKAALLVRNLNETPEERENRRKKWRISAIQQRIKPQEEKRKSTNPFVLKRKLEYLNSTQWISDQLVLFVRRSRAKIRNKETAYKNRKLMDPALKQASLEKRKEVLKTPEAKARRRKYLNEKYANDPIHKLRLNLRWRLRQAVRGNAKSGSAIKLLGCSVEFLKHHIESLWSSEMTWENWTLKGWHIDHIRPLASFDLTDAKQLSSACHYTNLQPMWWLDNIKKSAHFPGAIAS